jgi:hypothetical protein
MIKRLLSLVSSATLLASLALVGLVPTALANVNGAAFTTDNPGYTDGNSYANQACLNGGAHVTPGVNCNLYSDKRDVWINGGPSQGQNHLTAGDYFFSVLVPGGQPDPNDGGAENLSDTTAAPYAGGETNSDGSTVPSGDEYSNRTFHVDASGHVSSYGGTHQSADGGSLGLLIQLFPYDDTTNPGGVYILAICSTGTSPAVPSQCKYDAFKVVQGSGCDVNCGGGQGLPLSVIKDAAGAYTNTYKWSIDKTADDTVYTAGGADGSANFDVKVQHDSGTLGGYTVTGTIDAFNPNSGSVVADVTDQLSDATVCSVTDGAAATLVSGDNYFSYDCDLAGAPQGELDNTVTVTWDAQTVVPDGDLTAGHADFTFSSILFTGSDSDTCITVNDTNPAGPQGEQVCVGDANPTEFKYSGTVSGAAGTCTPNDNTADFTTSDTSATDSSKATVNDCQGADLTVTKTASASYTRTYNWSIRKTVDEATHIDQIGGSVTLHYHVTATETGFTDSAWVVSGTITVTNPNDWEDVTLSDVTDAVDNGGSCTVDKTGGMTVAKSGTKDFPYSCTYASKPTYNVTAHNKATITWSASAASTPTGTADTGNVDFSFTTPTSTINKTITVQDAYNGGSATDLGQLTATDSTPYTTHTYDVTKTVTVPTNGSCVTMPNSGIIKETGAHSDVSNTICGVGAPGALTMGYWQNKNGQTIIANYSGTACASLRTWLSQFHAFSDISSRTTCGSSPSLGAKSSTGVTGYVYDVVKAAVCTSSSKTCNSMLKAQMLATALDVYFSDSTLGGNRIGAPSAIGSKHIDLTKICTMIDSTNGTATCSGTYVNVSAQFNNTSCMTVMAMLQWQNTSDPAVDAGLVWYGQNKTYQVNAKNAFDSINNQVDFAC